MRPSPLIALLFAASVIAVAASTRPAETSRPGAVETLPLFAPAEAKLWSAAESTVQASTARTRGAPVALHWHVTVDFSTGEAKYPIGWPRVSRTISAGPLRDWSEWDYLHFWIYTASNREKLPLIPAGLGLHTPDRATAYQRTLAELRTGEWVEFNLPLTQIPRHHDVRNLQFHIAESNYRDGDRLDFYVSDLALTRHAAPTILAWAPESAVVFADAKRLPLRLHLAGLRSGQSARVVCTLSRNGRTFAQSAVPGARGVQVTSLELGSTSLAPGDYELSARLDGSVDTASARVRLVESPWK